MQKRFNHYSGVTRRGNLWRGEAAVSLDACCPPKRRGPNSASGCRYFDQSLYTTSFRFMWTVAVFCPPFGVVSQIPEFSFLSRKIKSRKLFQWDVIGGLTLYQPQIIFLSRNPVFEQGFLILVPGNASHAELKVKISWLGSIFSFYQGESEGQQEQHAAWCWWRSWKMEISSLQALHSSWDESYNSGWTCSRKM